MADLQYTVTSLRRQWQEATSDEDRTRIEVLGRQAVAELEAVKAQALPTLAELEARDQAAGQDGSLPTVLIEALVLDLVSFFNVGKQITEAQIHDSAHLIYQEYRFRLLEEIALAFQRVKQGKYGEVYDRIDGGTIMRWLARYFEELREQAIEERRRRHLSLKDDGRKGGIYRLRDLKPTVLPTPDQGGTVPPTIGDILND